MFQELLVEVFLVLLMCMGGMYYLSKWWSWHLFLVYLFILQYICFSCAQLYVLCPYNLHFCLKNSFLSNQKIKTFMLSSISVYCLHVVFIFIIENFGLLLLYILMCITSWIWPELKMHFSHVVLLLHYCLFLLRLIFSRFLPSVHLSIPLHLIIKYIFLTIDYPFICHCSSD